MDAKVTGLVSYIGFLGWLIAYLAGDKEGAKFHLNQALLLNIAGLIPVVNFVALVFSIIGMIAAWNGEEKEAPIIGHLRILK